MLACHEEVRGRTLCSRADGASYERKLRDSLVHYAPTAQATLVLLAVDPPYQRRGIGSALLHAGLDRFSCIALSTEDKRVVTFYERFGLSVVDTFETEGDTTWVLTAP